MDRDIRFACIATNGSDPEPGQDVIVPVTPEQARKCGRMGSTTATSLGITLTREQLSIVGAGTLRDCGPF